MGRANVPSQLEAVQKAGVTLPRRSLTVPCQTSWEPPWWTLIWDCTSSLRLMREMIMAWARAGMVTNTFFSIFFRIFYYQGKIASSVYTFYLSPHTSFFERQILKVGVKRNEDFFTWLFCWWPHLVGVRPRGCTGLERKSWLDNDRLRRGTVDLNGILEHYNEDTYLEKSSRRMPASGVGHNR